MVRSVPSRETLLPIAAPPKLSKRSIKRITRWGLISGNVFLLVAIGAFIIINRSANQTVRTGTANKAVTTAASVPNPLDHVSSAQIALQAAQMTKVPELTAVHNQADSENALLAIVPNDTTSVAKPQIVTTSQKSRYDIISYVVQNGDTADSVAAKFHVTTGSITGSNGLGGTALKPGVTILIPPGNGIIYKVGASDSVGSIVSKYGADRDLLIAVNDAEGGLKPGDNIWIPNVTQPGISLNYSTRVASTAVPNYSPIYGYNGYDYGFCTWYVASKVAIPSNWGNANTWARYARTTPGWAVSLTPVAGAVGQNDGPYLGHVGIVEEVSADGTMIKYSDMNGLAGWGRVGRTSDWTPASHFQHFIYPSSYALPGLLPG